MPRYSAILLEHFEDPQNLGRMDSPDTMGTTAISGGARFAIYLRIDANRVVEAMFEAHGCGVTVAAGSMLTELIVGRSIDECLAMTAERLADALGGVPPDKRHSPMLAVGALHNALRALDSTKSGGG